MHNYRQLELQGIIKTLESKVNSLNKQLQSLEQRQSQKIAAALSREKKIIGEKDRTIALLMEEGRKLRQQSNLKHSRNIALIEDQYRSREESTAKLQTNNMELETKLKQLSQYNEQKTKQKDKELQQTKSQLKKLQKQRKIIIDEVQKMNKFSVQAARRQPQREQTLLWVNKLIEFMSKTNQMVVNENKQRQQLLLNITLHISQELRQLNMEYSKHDTATMTEKMKFLEEMQGMISHVQIDCKEAARTNQQFWEGFSRVRNKEEKQYITKLETQLQSTNESKQKELQQLRQELNAADKDKKSLLVNLQELKCYYQLRERANKQEIDYLKKSIQDLIKSQDIREQEYERQIQKMGQQIQHLTVKFYQKVQLPINTVYGRIKEEVGRFQHNYENFFTNTYIQTQIKQFQAIIVDYLMKLNEDKDLRQNVKDAAKQTDKICQFLNGHYKGTDLQSNLSGIDPNISFSFCSNVTEENRQQQKKLTYELATAKKHIQKLKDHIKNLEGKYSNNRIISNQVNSKILELSAENQLLKQKIRQLEKNHHDRQTFSDQMLEQSRIGRINTALLQQVVLKNQEILRFVRNEDEYLGLLTKCVDSLNTVLLSPMQTFQHLINEIKSISTITFIPPRKEESTGNISNLDQMKTKRLAYEEIISRKNDAGASIIKASSEMMKVVRQILSKNNASKNMKQTEIVHQHEKPKFLQSRQMLEKRAKDIHIQRMKVRQEMLERILNLEEKIKNIDNRANKKQNFPFIRFQQSICKKLTQLFGSLMPKQRLKDFKKITQQALNDATTKLIECKLENQGLLKELSLLRKVTNNE